MRAKGEAAGTKMALRSGGLRAAALCALLGAVLALSGCSGSDEQARSAITEGIQSDMASLTALTETSAAQVFASSYTTELQGAGVSLTDVYGPMFSSLAYSIDGVTVNGSTAQVMLTVTNKDLTAALQLYTTSVTNELATTATREQIAALDDNALVQHLAEVLEQSLTDASIGTKTTQVTLTYQKSGSRWELADNSALVTALLGGLDTSAVAGATDATATAAAATDASSAGQVAEAAATEGEQAMAEGAEAVEGADGAVQAGDGTEAEAASPDDGAAA